MTKKKNTIVTKMRMFMDMWSYKKRWINTTKMHTRRYWWYTHWGKKIIEHVQSKTIKRVDCMLFSSTKKY